MQLHTRNICIRGRNTFSHSLASITQAVPWHLYILKMLLLNQSILLDRTVPWHTLPLRWACRTVRAPRN